MSDPNRGNGFKSITGAKKEDVLISRVDWQSLGSDMIDEMLAPAKLAIFVVMYPIFNLILVRVKLQSQSCPFSLSPHADWRVPWAGESCCGRHERSVGLSVTVPLLYEGLLSAIITRFFPCFPLYCA